MPAATATSSSLTKEASGVQTPNIASGYSMLAKSYINAVKSKFFGLRAYEKNIGMLNWITAQLQILNNFFPVDIYYNASATDSTAFLMNNIFPSLNGCKTTKFKIFPIPTSYTNENYINPDGMGSAFMFVTKKYELNRIIEQYTEIESRYISLTIIASFKTTRRDILAPKIPFQIIQVKDTDLYNKELTNRFLRHITEQNTIGYTNTMIAVLWQKFIALLFKIDGEIDLDILNLEATLKVISANKPSLSSSSNSSFLSTKSVLERYIKDTAADFQKRTNARVDEYYNSDTGMLVKRLNEAIENLTESSLVIQNSHKKDVKEVLLNQTEIPKFQSEVDNSLDREFNQKIVPDIKNVFTSIYIDINRDLVKKNLVELSTTAVEINLNRKLSRLGFDKSIVSDYISEISYIGKVGVYPKIKSLREGAFQLLIFVMMLNFLNPSFKSRNVLYTHPKGESKDLTHTTPVTEWREIKPTLLGKVLYFAEGYGTLKDENSEPPDILNTDQIDLIETTPTRFIGRGSSIGMVIAVILMALSYIEYQESLKKYAADEEERNLRNIKNELKSNTKRILQGVNKNIKDFVNESFTDLQNDLIRALDLVKSYSDERDQEYMLRTGENSNNNKYLKVKLLELEAFKKVNRAKIDEFQKFRS